MEEQGGNNRKKIKLACYIVGTSLAVYLAFRFLLPLVFPFLFAYAIAKILRPIVLFLQKKCHWKENVSIFAAVLLFVIVVGGVTYYLGNIFIQQTIALIKNLPRYQQLMYSQVKDLCCGCDRLLRWNEGTTLYYMEEKFRKVSDHVTVEGVPNMSRYTISFMKQIFTWFAAVGVIAILSCMILKEKEELQKSYESCIFYKEIHSVLQSLSEAGIAYLKAQLIIIALVASTCAIGLFLLKNPYALLLGIGISIFDAFPILGSGLILVPWAVVRLLANDIWGAVFLLIIYLLCQLIREFLEPKLLGNKIGLSSVYTLCSVYAGVKLFGICGVFLGPIALVLIRTIVKGML